MLLQRLDYDSHWYQQSLALREQVLRLPLGRKLDAHDLAGEAQQWHLALVHDQNILACLVIKPEQRPLAKLRQMAVQPAMQGQGLGQRLVLAVEQWLISQGFDQIKLDARLTALAFISAWAMSRRASPLSR
ncbi:GNAT family N-acetyltransferase [Methylobacillus glycogenes]|uniref:GNAT family N-acetyltransferase n=1 Tax=Methylobacillus glycogenes TaxID=406 RepID=UPI00068535BF|nr:GNAT family N-acetyltransferase [Methylobacillus glycogenes]